MEIAGTTVWPLISWATLGKLFHPSEPHFDPVLMWGPKVIKARGQESVERNCNWSVSLLYLLPK